MIYFTAIFWPSAAKTKVKRKIKYILLFPSVQFQQLTLKTSGNKALTGVNIAVVCKHLPDENYEDDEGLFLRGIENRGK